MKNRAQKIRLGIFIAIGSALIVFLVTYFAALQILERKDTYFVSFQEVSVTGLEVGSPVRYLGIKVGTISDISIDPHDITSIVVELSLKRATPVKEDSKANIVSMGITGLKSVEIREGTNESKYLEPGSYIDPGLSLADEITGKAEIIVEKAELILNNLLRLTDRENINKLTDMIDNYDRLARNTDQTILRIDTLIRDNRTDIQSTVESANKITQNLMVSSQLFNETMLKINEYTTSDSISDIIGNVYDLTNTFKEANFKELIENLANVAQQTQQLLMSVDEDINKGSQYLVESQSLLNSTLRNIDELSRKINRDPSLLIRGGSTKDAPDDLLKN